MQVCYLEAMKHTSLAEMACPAARALDVIGEWWTLLIVRDALGGKRRFDEFKGTGIADNILSSRLKRLVEAGILDRQRYQTRPDRYEYTLTERGRELLPIVASLREWGRRWTQGEDHSPPLIHSECGHEVSSELLCNACNRKVAADEVRAGAARGAVWEPGQVSSAAPG